MLLLMCFSHSSSLATDEWGRKREAVPLAKDELPCLALERVKFRSRESPLRCYYNNVIETEIS